MRKLFIDSTIKENGNLKLKFEKFDNISNSNLKLLNKQKTIISELTSNFKTYTHSQLELRNNNTFFKRPKKRIGKLIKLKKYLVNPQKSENKIYISPVNSHFTNILKRNSLNLSFLERKNPKLNLMKGFSKNIKVVMIQANFKLNTNFKVDSMIKVPHSSLGNFL